MLSLSPTNDPVVIFPHRTFLTFPLSSLTSSLPLSRAEVLLALPIDSTDFKLDHFMVTVAKTAPISALLKRPSLLTSSMSSSIDQLL